MGRTIEDIRVVDVEKRKIPSKHYVYVIYVTWSDGSTNVIYRRYSRFFDFQVLISEMLMVPAEQNPGPSKQTKVHRRVHQPHLPNWSSLTRQHSFSSTGINSLPTDMTWSAENSGMTQLLSSVQAHMNTNMSYIQKNMSSMNTRVDHVAAVCKELSLENEALRLQNKEIQGKMDMLGERLVNLEHVMEETGALGDEMCGLVGSGRMNEGVDASEFYLYDFVTGPARAVGAGEEDVSDSDTDSRVAAGTRDDSVTYDKVDAADEDPDELSSTQRKGKPGSNILGLFKGRNYKQLRKVISRSKHFVRNKTEKKKRLFKADRKNDWVLPVASDRDKANEYVGSYVKNLTEEDIDAEVNELGDQIIIHEAKHFYNTTFNTQKNEADFTEKGYIRTIESDDDGENDQSSVLNESSSLMNKIIDKKIDKSIVDSSLAGGLGLTDAFGNADLKLPDSGKAESTPFYSIPLRMSKTPLSFAHSELDRANDNLKAASLQSKEVDLDSKPSDSQPVAKETKDDLVLVDRENQALEEENLYSSIPFYTGERNRRSSLPVLTSHSSLFRTFSNSWKEKESNKGNNSGLLSRSVSFSDKSKLMEMFPEEAGTLDPRKRIIPFLPGKKFFGRSHIREVAVKRMAPIAEYCKSMLKLPRKISQSKEVVEFFELEPDDIDPPKDRKKASIKGDKISMPKALEHYIAVTDYKKQEKGEITLKVGMLVEIVEKTETGWWFVSVEDEQGWVPSTCLEREDGVKEDTTQKFKPGEEEQYLCTEEFKPQGDDELALERGAVVEVIEKNLEGWWVVRYNGKEGYVPATYLMKSEAFSVKKQKVVRASIGGPEIVKTLHDISDLLKEEEKEEQKEEQVEKSFTIQELSKILKEDKRGSAETEKVYECIESMKSRSLKRGGSVRPPPRPSIKPKKGVEALGVRKKPPIVHAESFCKEYVTIADFADAVGDGISFKAGEVVKVLEKSEGGWWYIEIGDKEGWAPATYIEDSVPRPRSPMLVENQAEKNWIENDNAWSSDSDSDADEAASRQSGVGALANVLKSKLDKSASKPQPPPPPPVKKEVHSTAKDSGDKTISDSKVSINTPQEKTVKKDMVELKDSGVKDRKIDFSLAAKNKVQTGDDSNSVDIRSAFGLQLKPVVKGKSKEESSPKSSNMPKAPVKMAQKPPPPPKAQEEKLPLSPGRSKKPPVLIPSSSKTIEEKHSGVSDNRLPVSSNVMKTSNEEPDEMKPNVKGLAGALKAKFESGPVMSTNTSDSNKINISSNSKQSKFGDVIAKPGPPPAKPSKPKPEPFRATGEPKRFGQEDNKKPDIVTKTNFSGTKDLSSAHHTGRTDLETEVKSGGKVSDLASMLKSKLDSRNTIGDSNAHSQDDKQGIVPGAPVKPPNLRPNVGAKPQRPVTPPSPKTQHKVSGVSPLSVIENRQSSPRLNEDSVSKLNAMLDGSDSKGLDPKKYSSRPLPPKPADDTSGTREDTRKPSVPNISNKPVPNLAVKPKLNNNHTSEPKQPKTFKNDSVEMKSAGVSGIASALKSRFEDNLSAGLSEKPDIITIKPVLNKPKPITAVKPKADTTASGRNISSRDINLEKVDTRVGAEINEELFCAIADFPGENEGEIELTIGVEVKVLERADCWWYVTYDSKEGWAPSTYLEQVRHSRTVADKLVSNRPIPAEQKTPVFRTCSDFTAENDGELSFNSGETVTVLEKPEGGWWFVQIGRNEGWVPETYLEEIMV